MDQTTENDVRNLLKQFSEQLASKQGVDKLAKAYVSAWAEMDAVVTNSTNPHFGSDYADLKAVLDTMRPTFAKYELALLQAPGTMNTAGDRVSLPGILMHSSGQHFSFTTELPIGPKSTAQAAGSAITYARRYQAQAIAGIAPTDDDGNAASARNERSEPQTNYAAEATELTALIASAATPDAVKALKSRVEELGDDKVATTYVARLSEMKRAAKK